jgi:tetraacyldisaccharide 4'-kinase
LPLEAIYRAAVGLRRWAYRTGWRKSEVLPVPVIVVGNLTVGGTGKTPLTIWLALYLRSQGWSPGVVSRGYGSSNLAAPRAVAPDSDPAVVGDEPVLLARRTGCPVYIFPARAKAARALLAHAGCTILIADDGLQHYGLGRNIEIAVIDGMRKFGNGHCLPAGPLREPSAHLAHADLVVCTGGATGEGHPMTLEGGEAVNLANDSLRRPLESFRGQPLVAVAGIGNPQRFFDHLRGFDLDFSRREFPDHYAYRAGDLDFAMDMPVLMTEKDAVKWRRFGTLNHWFVPVTARLPREFEVVFSSLLRAKCNGQKATGNIGLSGL